MKKTKVYSHKIDKKGAFGIVFSLVIILVALPLWAGALLNRAPHIDIFSADAEQGFRLAKEIEFKIKGGDDNDSSVSALLDYGDGKKHSFSLLGGVTYLKRYAYIKAGSYDAKIVLKDSSGKERGLKLELTIYDRWIPEIKEFSLNEESSNFLGERVYLNYEIECKDTSSDIFDVQIEWGDARDEVLEIFCGPAIISHKYHKTGTYDLKLKVKDLANKTVASKVLIAVIYEEKEEKQAPKANFFIKTAWPKKGEEVYFVDNSTDPQGRADIKTWQWDFGDSKTSSDINPTHIYTKSGRFKVQLTVTDRSGLKDYIYRWIEVFEGIKQGLVRVQGEQAIYQLVKGQSHWLPTPEIFLNYGYREQDVKIISQDELKMYPRAKLVRVGASPDIYYLTESWMKRKIPNMQVFYSYGNKLEDVISISQKELNWYPENKLIKFDDDWKVYYLENGIKHWIKSSEAFNRRGFDWRKIAPVNWQEINAYPTGNAID